MFDMTAFYVIFHVPNFLIVILDHSLLFRMTYTRCRIDTINSPDDGHMAVRNMYRIEINVHKRNCA